MYIKNIKGSSKVSSKPKEGSSWREFWEIKSGITIGSEYICPSCGRKVKIDHVDGCHVQKSRSTDESWYIVPLCDSCNHKTSEVGIPDPTKLVPVV